MLEPFNRPVRSPRSAFGGTLPASVLVLPVMEPTMTSLQTVKGELQTDPELHCHQACSTELVRIVVLIAWAAQKHALLSASWLPALHNLGMDWGR